MFQSAPAFGGAAAGAQSPFGARAPAPAGAFGAPAVSASPFATQPAAFGGAAAAAPATPFASQAPGAFGAAAAAPATPFASQAPGAFGAAGAAPATPFASQAPGAFGGAAAGAFGGAAGAYRPPGAAGAFAGQQQPPGTGHLQFKPTTEGTSKHMSIVAMPQYDSKSFEELRFEDYAMGRKGSGTPQAAGAAGAFAPAMSAAPALTPFGAPATSAAPGSMMMGTQAAGAFGRPAASTSPFGAAPAASASPFGAPAASAAPFGAAAPATSMAPGASPFGAPAASAAPFGAAAPATSMAPGASPFGARAPFASTAPAASPFGAAAPGTTPFGSTAPGTTPFGAAAAPGTAPFGSTAPGTTPFASGAPGTTPFGSTAPSPFGAPKPGGMFGAPAASTAPSMFGAPAASTAPSMFGAPGASAAPSMFGAAGAKPPFGAAPTTPGTGMFGTQPGAAGQSAFPAPASPFGAKPPGTGLFGATAPQQTAMGMPGMTGMPGVGAGMTGMPGVGAGMTGMPGMQQQQMQMQQTQQQQQQQQLNQTALQVHQALSAHPYSSHPLFLTDNQGKTTPGAIANVKSSVPKKTSLLTSFRPAPQSSSKLVARGRHTLFSASSSSRSAGGDTATVPGTAGRDKPIDSADLSLPVSLSLTIKSDPQPPASSSAMASDLLLPTASGSGASTPALHQFKTLASPPGSTAQQQLPATSPAAATSPPVQAQQLVRSPSQQVVTPAQPQSQVVRPQPVRQAPAVFLSRPEYYTEPSTGDLAKMAPEQLAAIKDFVVGRKDVGMVKFLGDTDVRGLNLDAIVTLMPKHVAVYNEHVPAPTVGQGLNKPALVTFHHCFPKNKKDGPMKPEEREKWFLKLQKWAAHVDGEFVAFDDTTGDYTFKVFHFSKYSLEDLSSDEDEPSDQPPQRRPQQQQQQRSAQRQQQPIRRAPGSEQRRVSFAANDSAADSLRLDVLPLIAQGQGQSSGAASFSAPPPPEDDQDSDAFMADELEDQDAADAADAVMDDHVENPAGPSLPELLQLPAHKMHLMKMTLFSDEPEADGDDDADNMMMDDGANDPMPPSPTPMDPMMPVATPAASFFRPQFTPVASAQSPVKAVGPAPRHQHHAPQEERPLPTPAPVHVPAVSPAASITRSREWMLADAGLAMGRSFRVGWGPNGVFVHPGRLAVAAKAPAPAASAADSVLTWKSGTDAAAAAEDNRPSVVHFEQAPVGTAVPGKELEIHHQHAELAFLASLRAVLDSPSGRHSDIVAWSADRGDTVVVHNADLFEQRILRPFFDMTLTEFRREVRTLGFVEDSAAGQFYNPHFVRDEPERSRALRVNVHAPQFALLLFDIVSSGKYASALGFGGDGNAYLVLRDGNLVQQQVLPAEFGHSDLSLFLRQLYQHGFQTDVTDQFLFYHPLFQAGRADRVPEIEPALNAPRRQLRMETALLDTMHAFADAAPDQQAARVWSLVVALWGQEKEVLRSPEARQLAICSTGHTENLGRKALVSAWVKATVRAAVDSDIAKTGAQSDQEAVLDRIFSFLSGRRIREACACAVEHNMLRLATLIAQVCGDLSAKAWLSQQLHEWDESGVRSRFGSSMLWKIYELLAGHTIAAQHRLDWIRAFGLGLWYGDVGDQVAGALDVYDEAVEAGLATDSADDTCYNLLALYRRRDHPLAAVLAPEAGRYNPLDYRLGWSLQTVLGALSLASSSSWTHSELIMSFVFQLEATGQWAWAVYAALQLPSAAAREQAVRALLGRHCDDSLTAETEALLQTEFDIPYPWIAEAKTLYSKYAGHPEAEVDNLLVCRQTAAAHKILLSLAPKYHSESRLGELGPLLEQVAVRADTLGDAWTLGGGIVLDFLQWEQAVQSGALDDAEARVELLRTAEQLCTRIQQCSPLREHGTPFTRLFLADLSTLIFQRRTALQQAIYPDAETQSCFQAHALKGLLIPAAHRHTQLRGMVRDFLLA